MWWWPALLSLGLAILIASTTSAAGSVIDQPGAVDPGFAQTTDDYGFDSDVKAVAVQSDGKILAGGEFIAYDGQAAPHLIRLKVDGSRDCAFTQTGTGLNGIVGSMAVQPDGKILAGGLFTSYDGQPYAFAIRLLGDPPLTPEFAAAPNPVAFADQQTGTSSVASTVTVINIGTGPLIFPAGRSPWLGTSPGSSAWGRIPVLAAVFRRPGPAQ